MKKIIFSGILFFLLLLTGCSLGFQYPDKSAFVLEVTISQAPYHSDETILLHCTLTNESKKDYLICHGSQAITYSVDGSEEATELLLISTFLASDDKITREIEIGPLPVGYHKIEIKCPISVTAGRSAQQTENGKEYTYSKTFEIEVSE